MVGVIKDKVYIPEQDITDKSLLHKYFEVNDFDERACERCSYKNDRPCDYCEACDAFGGIIKMWNTENINQKRYISIPKANMIRNYKIFGIDFSQYKDCRCVKKFETDVQWTGILREGEIVNDVPSANQVKITEEWLHPKRRYGFILAPPRTGKSVLSTNIACRIGMKTLVIAHQKELLQNFYKSWMRDTNIQQLEQQLGRKLIKIIEEPSSEIDPEEIKNYEVVLINYQKFIRPETREALIKKVIRGNFGLAIVDEAHQGGADAYGQFLNSLDCRYVLALSATPMRKDSKNQVLLQVLGPVTVKSETTGLIPRVEILETGIKSTKKYGIWAYAMKFLQQNEQRNKLILKEVVRDLQTHKCIIIPVDSKAHMTCLVDSINNHFAEPIAIGYWRGVKNRDSIFAEIDSGKYRVVVAIKGMIKQGIDLLSPSMIYVQSPMSAAKQPIGAPFFYQMGNRVATPYVGKIEPVIKVFVDGISESYGCFMSLMTKEIKPGLVAKENGRPRYKISNEAYKYGFRMVSMISKRCYSQSGTFNPDHPDLYREKKEISLNTDGRWS